MEKQENTQNATQERKVLVDLQETIQSFLKKESASGILLMIATVVALIIANSPLATFYQDIWQLPVHLRIGDFLLAKPLILWINDGLMAIFFLLVGLELKRELLEGELANFKTAMLPAFAAIGGIVFPALIYVFFNYDNPEAIRGWAIPAATDIAFALGVLSLLGNRVPLALKTFLVSLAIIDDVAAILIIALFYTSELSISALIVAAILTGFLALMNHKRVRNMAAYILVGVLLWVAILKSGIHATVAGVILAMCIPLRTNHLKNSLARRLEYDLHSPVAYCILPLFAFANAGLDLSSFTLDALTQPISLGILLGLFAGKQLGVFLFALFAVKIGIATLPAGIGWHKIYGVSILTGIGFTMSLFISSLAFESAASDGLYLDRVGIFIGSLLSAVVGYLYLKVAFSRDELEETKP